MKKNWLFSMLLVSLLISCWSTAGQAGAWDEHMVVQSLLNDLLLNSGVGVLESDLACFLSGVLQHQLYDLTVNERPIHIHKIARRKVVQTQTETGTETAIHWEFDLSSVGAELPSALLNLTGVGLSIWHTQKQYLKDANPSRLRMRFFGLLGSVAPDILEGTRLALLGREGAYRAWMRGDTEYFHVPKPANWRYPVDTVRDNQADLKRRGLLQILFLTKEIIR